MSDPNIKLSAVDKRAGVPRRPKPGSSASRLTDQARLYVKQHHHYWTEPREAIFRSLQRSPAPLPELIQRLHGDIDSATVYRTVALFEKLGIVHRIWAGWNSVIELTDRFSPHHHHLVCENCERIVDFEDAAFEQALTTLARRQGFTARHHHVELFGLCQNCQS